MRFSFFFLFLPTFSSFFYAFIRCNAFYIYNHKVLTALGIPTCGDKSINLRIRFIHYVSVQLLGISRCHLRMLMTSTWVWGPHLRSYTWYISAVLHLYIVASIIVILIIIVLYQLKISIQSDAQLQQPVWISNGLEFFRGGDGLDGLSNVQIWRYIRSQ